MSPPNSAITKNKDNSFLIKLTIPQSEIEKEYQKFLLEAQKNHQSTGFRPGKTPLETIKSEHPFETAASSILSNLASVLYQDAVTKNGLKPIVPPQVKIVNPPLATDKDCEIEITACETPSLTLDPNYQASISALVPSDNKDSQLNAILDLLLQKSQISFSPLLISYEVNRKISSLIDQATQAGISLTDYLKSKGLNIEQYRQKVEKETREEWQINLAIEHIAKDQNITPSDQELENAYQKNPQLKSNPDLAGYLVTQQKVIDFLLGLVKPIVIASK